MGALVAALLALIGAHAVAVRHGPRRVPPMTPIVSVVPECNTADAIWVADLTRPEAPRALQARDGTVCSPSAGHPERLAPARGSGE